ncbi:MAG: hypothetical protein IKG96_11060 [Bacteroidaceae bacterium]|nr:hypothetical protein [Bacteroidaceae bacterium]MBR3444177.1 hypothetical protein [Bacteroidaceae bacterium]
MKKYIQPTIEQDMLRTLGAFMLTVSGEQIGVGGSGSGGGSAKEREEIEEEMAAEAAAQQNAWEIGLW